MTADPTRETVKPRAASVFDVAKVAGVSHQTVSRVLNDHPSLRAETRQRVLDAMRELDYRPNAAARALSSSRSRMIGVLSTSSGEYGPASIVAAVEAAARSRGYSVTIANADGLDPRSVDEAVRHLADLSAEGLVVVAPQTQVLEALAGLAITLPYVTLQALGADGGGTLDQVIGARLATAHLVLLGHRRIGHIAGPADWVDAAQRLSGFRAELAEHGIDANDIEIGDWSAASGHLAASRLIARGVTAIFAGNDQMALGALSAAAGAGVAVPSQLSVVGFDDVPEAAYYQPALTTVRQDLAEAGRRAVALLLGESEALPSVHPELIVRASTAPMTYTLM
ncbi:LacI family transcriptional regulator [Subtercola boreus]|uniref:LacI family transcriptional regulator n=1 Tax=Subtercola boreus TaxID=120213 RepID=A0A3E0VLN7_9MICO|nr:LacI family DNA-binding transcriptional regulator [Subtercola boreus]RFA10350.1 LacI family transcriptional regulator [Subtercola boreus]TQL56141.1 LacI family transcriptional regulator [Subtercola boreus]